MVRTAVIKGKNPTDIILELEKLDDMEFNVLVAPPLNEKVMREKRRKLMETWHRVIQMYEKEDVDQHVDLKKMWSNYLKRKEEVMDHYEAVKTAQNIDIDDIPLPNNNDNENGPGDIPLPPNLSMAPKVGILKKSSVLDSLRPKTCPGVPSGAPPPLSDYETFEVEAKTDSENRSKRIRFAGQENSGDATNTTADDEEESEDKISRMKEVDNVQKKMLAVSGQDVDAYMKEMEEVHKKTEAEKAADLRSRMARVGGASDQPGPPGEIPPAFVHVSAPGGFMVRPPGAGPPQLRPGMPPPGVRLPPGPPPGRPQLPPGPPPGRPPFMGVRPPLGGPIPVAAAAPGVPLSRPRAHMPRPLNPQVVSAGPQINAGPSKPVVKTGSVIEAKPQMKNLLKDVTRFVPTNVKVKRADDKSGGGVGGNLGGKKKQNDPLRDVFVKHAQPVVQQQQQQGNKDDAYAQFMAEMEKMM